MIGRTFRVCFAKRDLVLRTYELPDGKWEQYQLANQLEAISTAHLKDPQSSKNLSVPCQGQATVRETSADVLN